MFWSEETFRIFGYDRAAKPAVEAILQRVHPEDKAMVQEQIDHATREGGAAWFDIVCVYDRSEPTTSSISRWNGDSRGHREGNTLVVETTNFRPGATYQDANLNTLKITEDFTRTSETTIEYKFTLDDPTTWTAPWSAIVPFSRIKGPMRDIACSEGNFSLVEILAAARAADEAGREKVQTLSIR